MPGISDSPPSRPKRLVPTNFSPRYFSSPLRLDHALHDHAPAVEGEVGAVLDVLDALLDPRLLGGIGDVHVFDTDLAAVGLAQPVHDLAQGGSVTQPERPEDQDRAVPVGLLEAVGRGIEFLVRRLVHQAERIEVGREMAADTIGADQQERARCVVCRGADLFIGAAGQRHGRALAGVDVAVRSGARHLGVGHVDDPRTVGRPGRAAHLGQHVTPLLGQRLEEGSPVGIDPARIIEEARVEFLDERRIGAEQE